MKRMLIPIAAVAALAIGLFAQSQAGPGMHREQFLQRIADYLQLTDAQRAQAKTIFQNAFSQAHENSAAVQTARQKLETDIKAGAANDVISADVAAVESAVQPSMVARATAVRDFWKILTPEQQQKASDLQKLFGFGAGGMGPMGMRHPLAPGSSQ